MTDNPKRILIVDDNPENIKVIADTLHREGTKLAFAQSGEEALKRLQKSSYDLILMDVMMPGMDGFETVERIKEIPEHAKIPIIFLTAKTDEDNKVKAFEIGGVDYITKPFAKKEVLARVKTHITLHQQQQQLEKQNADLIALNEQLQQEISQRKEAEEALEVADVKFSILSEQEAQNWGVSSFIGKSQKMRAIFDEIRHLQDIGTISVLILGECGTGKELIARAIHYGGVCAKGPFIAVNCSAIPEGLTEAAFFGNVRGAFTGAVNARKGYFELANNGTLFLDEIGDMPLLLQSKLLRTLENGTLIPVGGHEEIKVNVHVLAATNANLSEKMAAKEFRDDLYYRLAGYTIQNPSLRERKEDIPLLVQHFLSRFAQEMVRSETKITPEALAVLENYHFPGNIRELKNIIGHALISSGGAPIQPQHLHIINLTPPIETISSSSDETSLKVETVEQTLQIDHEKKILAYVRKHGSIKNVSCQELLGLDQSARHRVSDFLDKMTKQGKLVREGSRRGTYYRLP